MAWRFKASKYKNAAPIVPKPENCVRDISVGSYQTYGNNIAASAAFMAFNVDHNGSSLGVLPIDDCGRKGKTMPLLHAHTDTVTDMDFSNFHDGLLATGSQDCMVKVWVIGEKGLEESLTNPQVTLPHKQRRVECVRWHPSALGLLTSTASNVTTLWDLLQEKQLYSHSGDKGLIQSISWHNDGSYLALHSKDKYLYLLDPRSDKVTMSTPSHQSIKDSRVVCLGNTNRILTTGFDSARQREVYLRDIRNFNTPEKTLVLDSSTGILIPLYDADTGMLFLAGKGDITISYMEVIDREPYLVEGLRHTGEQTKGACLIPKRALNIMQGEVNRVLQLTSSSIIPIMYQVPRKSYRDFHSDLYPETAGVECSLLPNSWFKGSNTPVSKISLDPANNNLKPRLGPKPFCVAKFESDAPDSTVQDIAAQETTPVESKTPEDTRRKVPEDLKISNDTKPEIKAKPKLDNGFEMAQQNGTVNGTNHNHNDQDNDHSPDNQDKNKDNDFERGGSRASIAERRRMYEGRSQSVQEPVQLSPVPLRRRDSLKNLQPTLKEEEPVKVNQTKSSPPTPAAPKRTSTVFGRVSKYRHLKGTPAHKSLFIENVRNISRQISGECDGFHGNKERLAMPLGGAGGKIAVLELSRVGKLPDGVLPTLVNGSNVMDFAWDPFNNNRLAVGCDDGTLRLWQIPEGGLTEPTNTPSAVLQAHNEKIYCLKWHPLASDIIVTTSYDQTTKVWDLTTGRPAFLIHQDDQVVALGWSSCGKYLSTVTRSSVIRVYEPRVSEQAIMEGKGPGGSRGARILWTLQGSFIIVTGFDKVSERQIMAFRSDDLSSPVGTVSLDVSPAILIPFYDEDSSTLFLTGRGDSTIYAFEVSDEAPYLNALSHHRCSSTHQGLAFLTKNCCDVASVEFAKAFRLSNTTIEPLSFTVPRIKSDLFQDDLFPDTKVIWEATMDSSEWLSGSNTQPPRISLRPPGMDTLSDSQGSPGCDQSQTQSQNQTSKEEPVRPIPAVRQSGPWGDHLSAKQAQQQIEKSVSKKLEVNMKLEQDHMEGVDEKEWVE